MFVRLARWFLRLFGLLDLVFLELGGDAERAWVVARTEKGPLLPESLARLRSPHPFVKGLADHEGEGRYRLRGDQVWTFLETLVGRSFIRLEASSGVAWKKVAPRPLDVEVDCDPAQLSLSARYLGEAKWARGGWLRQGDEWWNAGLTDEHAELVLKREVRYGPDRLRRVLEEFVPKWSVRGSIWRLDPKRSLTRATAEPADDGSVVVRCEYVVPKSEIRPLPDGWALAGDAVVPLPKLPETLDRALREGPVRLEPEAAAEFIEREGLVSGAKVLAKSAPVVTARVEGDDLLLELALVWAEDAFALESEIAGKRVVRRGMNWCRVEPPDRAALAAALKRAFLDARPEGVRFRLRHDDVPEFLAYGSSWLKEWRLLLPKNAPPIVRPPTKPVLQAVRAESGGLGYPGMQVAFDLEAERVGLAELAALLPEGTRWLRRGGRWIEFDRELVSRVLERVPPRTPLDRPIPIEAASFAAAIEGWKKLGPVSVEPGLAERLALSNVRPSWPPSFAVSSPTAMRAYAWLDACAGVGLSPAVHVLADRDLFAAVAAFVKSRGARPVLVVAGSKRIAAWTSGLSTIVPVRTLVLKRKAPSQEEIAGADVVLVAPNSLDTAVFRAVDTDWPVAIFDQIDRTFATAESKPFHAASRIRARMRIAFVADRKSIAKAPKMAALSRLLRADVGPASHDAELGRRLVEAAPAAAPPGDAPYVAWRSSFLSAKPILAKPEWIRRHACEILNLEVDRDAKTAIQRLQYLWRAYRATHPQIDEYLIDWIADLYYLHVGRDAGLAWQWKHADLLPSFPELELFFEMQEGRVPPEAWRRLVGGRQGTDGFDRVAAADLRPPERSYRLRRFLFRGAEVRTNAAREIVVGRARRWSALAAEIHALLRAPRTPSAPPPVRLELNFARVEELRQESDAVAEILAAPEDAAVPEAEETVEPVKTADGRVLYESLAAVRAVWRELDFVSRQVLTDVHRGAVRRLRDLEVQLRATGRMPLAEIDAINERAAARLNDALLVVEDETLSVNGEFRDELEVLIDGRIVSAEESNPYQALVAKLAPPEKALLTALAKEGPLASSKADDLLRPMGAMSAVTVEGVNEKALETVGDLVIETDGASFSIEADDLDSVRGALQQN